MRTLRSWRSSAGRCDRSPKGDDRASLPAAAADAAQNRLNATTQGERRPHIHREDNLLFSTIVPALFDNSNGASRILHILRDDEFCINCSSVKFTCISNGLFSAKRFNHTFSL